MDLPIININSYKLFHGMLEKKKNTEGSLNDKEKAYYCKKNILKDIHTGPRAGDPEKYWKQFTLASGFRNFFRNIPVADCLALKIARLLLDSVENKKCPLTRSGKFTPSFYRACIHDFSASGFSHHVTDRDLLLIYFKQTVILLKTAGLVSTEGVKPWVREGNYSDEYIYFKLLNAFWNDVCWGDIFPSDPEAAVELKKNRTILVDLVLKNPAGCPLDCIANEFFDLTGFSRPNDLFMISFLDFYFFAWLKNFGILRYHEGAPDMPVHIEITGHGGEILNALV